MRVFALIAALAAGWPAAAGELALAPTVITEWKPIYGRVEARTMAPARARIGGTIIELDVSEGDLVEAGQKIARVRDDKLAYQIDAVDAKLRALEAQLQRAEGELERGQTLIDKGVITTQRIDSLRTDVEVTRNQIAAARAEREVVLQQQAEGDIFAPSDGRVLTVPVTRDAVIMAGEAVANIGSGGFFLRLAIPERHAGSLREGTTIRLTTGGEEAVGQLVKIYPQIENGRVIADVEIGGVETAFVDARLPVEVPVGEREALLVPVGAVTTRSGIDFVTVSHDGEPVERSVVLGERTDGENGVLVEVLTGLSAGETVLTP